MPNVLTPDEEARGWYLLWDGEDPANGWVGVSAGCSNFTARGWSVTNGALVASAGADPIRTASPYKDFDLKVDYRLAAGASGSRVVARRKPVTHWLDGRIVERKTRDNAELEGRIVLAPGEGQVEFRNVKIRPFGKW